MLEKTTFGILRSSRALWAGAAAALIAASIAMGAGPVAASRATSRLSQGNTVAWSLLMVQKQAAAAAEMRKAGVGPSLAGNSP